MPDLRLPGETMNNEPELRLANHPANPEPAINRSVQEQFDLAKSAIHHVLNAIADDPRKYWLMGNGTGSWAKLTVHTLVLVVERRLVFNAFGMRAEFEALMYWIRKWGNPPDPVIERARVEFALTNAVAYFTTIGRQHGQF